MPRNFGVDYELRKDDPNADKVHKFETVIRKINIRGDEEEIVRQWQINKKTGFLELVIVRRQPIIIRRVGHPNPEGYLAVSASGAVLRKVR